MDVVVIELVIWACWVEAVIGEGDGLGTRDMFDISPFIVVGTAVESRELRVCKSSTDELEVVTSGVVANVGNDRCIKEG